MRGVVLVLVSLLLSAKEEGGGWVDGWMGYNLVLCDAIVD